MLHGHLLGIYEKAFPSEWSWARRLKAAEELGFDFIEISIDESDGRLSRLDWNGPEREELHRALAHSAVNLQSMCLSGHRRFPFGSADAETRARAYDIMEKAVLFAKEFGIRVIQLAGYDVYYEPSTQESLDRFMDGLRWACGLAEAHQVMLAMEIMDTRLMNSITRYMDYKQELISPWFTVYPDLGNLSAWGNDVVQELALGKNEMVAIHLKDTLAVTDVFPGQFKCVPFGSGCVDFTGAFQQLERAGYRGPFLIEMWHQPGEDTLDSIRKALHFIHAQYKQVRM